MFDFIIVGAGSAGCVLANRLSADPSCSVLLLEAGGRDVNPLIHMPAGIGRLSGNERVNWAFVTEPEARLNNRRLWWPRGRVLGGCSSINAMCYVRAQPEDYDHWASLGNTGWSYDDVLPYFLRSLDQAPGAAAASPADGALTVKDLDYVNPLSRVFLEAASERGYPMNADFNGASQEGFGLYKVTQRNGLRCSTAVAFLEPVRSRPNLEVRTGALASKILTDGRRATGVEYRVGRKLRRDSAAEVVLCGDPQAFFFENRYINHPDHRAAGEAALEAAFPCSEMELLWPEEGPAHAVRAVYVSSTLSPNTGIDITDTIEAKIAALREHRSQLGERDPGGMIREWGMREAARWREGGPEGGKLPDGPGRTPRYAESFRVMILKPPLPGE